MRIFFISRRLLLLAGVVMIIPLLTTFFSLYSETVETVNLQNLMSMTENKDDPNIIFSMKTDKPHICITINVDWGEEHLPSIMETLQKYDAKATFFFTGRFADKSPDWVKKVFQAGHEIGNHGYSHPHPTQISSQKNREEMRRTDERLQTLTGAKPRWFASPYGEYDQKLVEVVKGEGYRLIMWTADTADWRNPSLEQWLKRIQGKTAPGAIILMHPTPSTAKALPIYLEWLQEKGLKAVTLTTCEQSKFF